MSRRNRKIQLQPIGEVLFSVLKKKGMASKLEENALMQLWPKAVGEQIATQTKPESFRNGILFVKTVSSVWVQQLHFVKQDILDKLNELSGKHAIKEIRFMVGYSPIKEKDDVSVSPAKKTVLKKRDKEMINECTERLADRELASVLKRVMQREISRRRQLEGQKVR
jgi:predicted nucleic acid-binding Zn ribbon protein